MIRLQIILIGLFLLPAAGCSDDNPGIPDDGMQDILNDAGMMNTPFITEGLQQPPQQQGAAAALPGDERIVGVIVDGAARAYSLKAMSGMRSHVINEVYGETPLSVTYCDRTDCVRVLTTDSPGQTIPLATGGFAEGQMLLKLGPDMYAQNSKEIPLADYEFEVATWQDWISRYPDSTVFISDESPPAESPPAESAQKGSDAAESAEGPSEAGAGDPESPPADGV